MLYYDNSLVKVLFSVIFIIKINLIKTFRIISYKFVLYNIKIILNVIILFERSYLENIRALIYFTD